ncbi:hypothetical protein [Rossellomorea vietnamensis]|uniref:hypothetical protein n=1 Tax=Rossellomorea vietnamensis TaxID=218284 RepID=UPI001E384B7D|nr:hypothetical protein [Rossellomorea vietnamensis]MCC5803116.1 hypothetical protein [Rossellomorea vietnamensis]
MNNEFSPSLVGKIVKVNRGGPESPIGKFLYGEGDHFALLTEKNGVVYFNAAHVKILSQNMKSGKPIETSDEEYVFIKEDSFGDLLKSLKNQWVKINLGDLEKLEGVLADANDLYITLVRNDEVIRVITFHIKTISNVNVADRKKEKSSFKNLPSNQPTSKKSKQNLSSVLYLDELEGAEIRSTNQFNT